jgi:chemotaxis signal transduction protein
MNVRGRIVTMVDGSLLLHGTPCDRHRATVLLVDVGPRGVGFAVDVVADVRVVRADEEYPVLDVRAAVARVVTISEDG